jgi:hypothetical protein
VVKAALTPPPVAPKSLAGVPGPKLDVVLNASLHTTSLSVPPLKTATVPSQEVTQGSVAQ